MRLPTQAPGTSASPAHRLFRALLFALSLAATPAFASHYVVDIGGSGDFTTIQAAIDAQFAVFRDTILVLPGHYPETIALPQAPPPQARILATGGAGATSAQSVTAPDDFASSVVRTYHFEGFTFTTPVVLFHQDGNRVRFSRCVFLQGLSSDPTQSASFPIVFDCDFYGRTTLLSSYGVWQSLRFHGAPLTITHAAGAGSFTMRDCSFEGPADTLVNMPWANNDYGAFDRCVFANANHGLVYGPDCHSITMPVTACVFHDLPGNAIATADTGPVTGSLIRARLAVIDSRFERCGTAVRWVHGWGCDINGNHGATLNRDTVLASTGDGVVLGPQAGGGIFDSIVDGSGGHGASFQQSAVACIEINPARSTVSNSRFTNNQLDGLTVRDSIPVTWTHYPHAPLGYEGPIITGSTFEENGGAGLRVLAARWRLQDCIAFSNGGDGFDLTDTSPGFAALALSNTSVANGGDGIRLAAIGAPLDSVHRVNRNLAATNTGAGIRVPAGGAGSLAFNDAWNNGAGQYVGAASPADSNLTVDPRFCDLGAGLAGLGLQQGSPCGAGGVYGLIGARPEECVNVTAVGPPQSGALAFAVRPTVARGSVEFVPPAAGPEGRVEVFDLSGRRLWSAPLGPATGPLRWRGETDRGRARAGFYWVRFTSAGESAARRLVWLESR